MNRTVLVVCGVLVVACTGAWTPAAAAARNPTCPSPSTTGAGAADGTGGAASTCRSSAQPKVESDAGDGPRYTVSKSVSPSGHVKPGQQVNYTVTVKAEKDVTGPGFTDDLTEVLDDATYNYDASARDGTATYADPVVSWAGGTLTAGQTVRITYSVTVNEPDRGDGVLRNDADPSPKTGGSCSTCAVTNAVAGRFTVAETSSPRPGASVHAGQTITYTVTVVGGDAPSYAQWTDSLSAGLSYAGSAKASTGTVGTSDGKLHWSGHLDAGERATITFAARVDVDARQARSTVTPVSADPYDGSCAASGSCELTHHLIAAAPSSEPISTPPPTAPPASTGGSQSAVALPDPPTTSTGPAIADTGAPTAGLGTLGVTLLLTGTGLLAAGSRTRRRARHSR